MILPQAVFNRMFILLGSDTATLGQTSTAVKLALAKAPFSPSPSLVIGDLTEATFPGYTVKDVAAAPQPQSIDPATGDSLLDMPPAGAFLWETTAAPSPPETIYGYYLVGDGPTLLGSQLLPTPVTLDAINQSITVPRTGFRQRVGSIS